MRWLRNSNIQTLVNARPTEGRFGVEVEVEGNPGVYENFGRWLVTTDGSLRGGSSREYVLHQPLNLQQATEAVNDLYRQIRENQGTIDNSMRAGVHIHLNVQNLTGLQLFNLLAVYYVFEELIVRQCGPHRQGNLFCLRMIDASGVNSVINSVLNVESFVEGIDSESVRYAAMNLAALPKYGSIEFRAIQTPTTPEPIIMWLQIFEQLMNIAPTMFGTPREFLDNLSLEGVEVIAERLFGPNFVDQIYNSQEDAYDSVMAGVRTIQQWVYMTEWGQA